jgi:hypothetical protein
MTWITVRGRRYYRRSKRVNGRVVSKHVGGGRQGLMAQQFDDASRTLRKLERSRQRFELLCEIINFEQLFEIDDVLCNLVTVQARKSGAYLHHRQWRWQRGHKMTSSQAANSNRLATPSPCVRNPSLFLPDLQGIPEEDRLILERAAQGDASAMAEANKYLTQPKYMVRWGDPHFATKCWLVSQFGGSDHLTVQATFRRADQLANDLGIAESNILEKLAISRIVNNWLAVGVLEIKVAKATTVQIHLAIERCLAQAERRLMQSLKALAFFRGVTVAALAKQLPVGTNPT